MIEPSSLHYLLFLLNSAQTALEVDIKAGVIRVACLATLTVRI